MTEYTLSIIKPDAVRNGHIGEVLRRFEINGFRIRAMKMLHLSKAEAESFYSVHRERPFFGGLTDFMSSGPSVVLCLEGDEVITRLRQLVGATNPVDAAFGTIRRELGSSVEQNAVHASDSAENARAELAFFFNALEIH
jgi:nucleoside-diphosphate kinase